MRISTFLKTLKLYSLNLKLHGKGYTIYPENL